MADVELQVAADFLEQHGFTRAAAALREHGQWVHMLAMPAIAAEETLTVLMYGNGMPVNRFSLPANHEVVVSYRPSTGGKHAG